MVTFAEQQCDLSSIDRLEGFRPGGHSMYQRVMVASLQGTTASAVWVYIMCAPQNGHTGSPSTIRPIFVDFDSIRHKTIDFGSQPM